jgi:3-methyladenine DNA glycosylase AlkD
MEADRILQTLDALASDAVRESLKRFAIPIAGARGIKTPDLHALARKIGRDHQLAAALWETGIFEARALAALVDEPEKVTRSQMDRWARAFDSWAICDCCCCYLFRKTPFARAKALEWAAKKPEFVKRAGFALMAYLALHDKAWADAVFVEFLSFVEDAADDDRPFVRKAVNWALRQIGKRNRHLHPLAIQTAEAIRTRGTRSARWIAADALRELRSAAVQARLRLAWPADRI